MQDIGIALARLGPTVLFCFVSRSTELMVRTETHKTVLFGPSTSVCRVFAAESRLRPSLALENKKLNSGTSGRRFFLSGTEHLAQFLPLAHTNDSISSSYDNTTDWET